MLGEARYGREVWCVGGEMGLVGDVKLGNERGGRVAERSVQGS